MTALSAARRAAAMQSRLRNCLTDLQLADQAAISQRLLEQTSVGRNRTIIEKQKSVRGNHALIKK